MVAFTKENSPVLSRYWSARKHARHYGNELRVLGSSGEILATVDIATGSARQARRVPSWVHTAHCLGAQIEVETSHGWQSRRTVSIGDGFYTRTVR